MHDRQRTAAAALVAAAALIAPAAAVAAPRPPAPRLLAPTTRVVRSSAVVFRWTSSGAGAAYQLRLSRSARFAGVEDAQVDRPSLRRVLPKGAWWAKVRVRPAVGRRWSVWSATRRVVVAPRVDILPPTRPGALSAPAVGELSVDVRFGRSTDEFGVIAYEVLANGAVVATVAGTTAHVDGLACATRYRLAARAVDAAGHRSVPSPVANVRTHPCTDLLAPSAPADVTAVSTTDESVALSWPDGTDPEGNVGGYVVTRDGVELGRPIGTGFVATHLAPGTPYAFAVRTRDRAGHVSADAASLTVTTAPPIQATGRVHAYLLATTEQSWTDLRAHYQQVAWVHPTFYTVNPDGTLNGTNDRRITDFAQARGIKVVPRVETQITATIHAVLTDQAARARLIDAIADTAAQEGYDGMNLDFEAGAATDRQLYTSFATDLAARLHAQGQLLSVCVSATRSRTLVGRAGFYDYASLSATADDLFVLAWNEHWSTSPAGPLASITWYSQVLAYMATFGRNGRFTIGTHLYGFDWPSGARGTPYEYGDLMPRLADAGAAIGYDAVAHEPRATYTAGDGVLHTVYWADAASIAERLQVASDRGFGLGMWRLGSEDQTVWDEGVLG